MSDLAERLEALAERNSEPLAPQTYDLTDEEAKAHFLELLSLGNPPPMAAEKAQRTATWFRRRRNPEGRTYDAEFAAKYDEIMAPEGEHREALIQNARAALIEAAKAGNVRAIEKILMAYDPDFAFMRPAAFTGDVNIDKLIQIMPGIPTELLQQMREELVRAKQAELPVIEQ